MNYGIHITRCAEHDLNSAVNYIEYVLLNPQAADDFLDTAEDKIEQLSSFPEKFALVEDPVLKSWGIRFTVINNYLAFYVISEAEKRVYIVRLLNNKRNWVTILKQGVTLE